MKIRTHFSLTQALLPAEFVLFLGLGNTRRGARLLVSMLDAPVGPGRLDFNRKSRDADVDDAKVEGLAFLDEGREIGRGKECCKRNCSGGGPF